MTNRRLLRTEPSPSPSPPSWPSPSPSPSPSPGDRRPAAAYRAPELRVPGPLAAQCGCVQRCAVSQSRSQRRSLSRSLSLTLSLSQSLSQRQSLSLSLTLRRSLSRSQLAAPPGSAQGCGGRGWEPPSVTTHDSHLAMHSPPPSIPSTISPPPSIPSTIPSHEHHPALTIPSHEQAWRCPPGQHSRSGSQRRRRRRRRHHRRHLHRLLHRRRQLRRPQATPRRVSPPSRRTGRPCVSRQALRCTCPLHMSSAAEASAPPQARADPNPHLPRDRGPNHSPSFKGLTRALTVTRAGTPSSDA